MLDLVSDQRVRRGPAARRPGAGAPAIAATVEVTERTSEPPRLRVRRRVRELYAYREIILNLVRKELKVKYTASVLGAVWSVLNPIVFLAVFEFVSKALGSSLDDYPVFLLAGLLAWNLFSVSMSAGAQSVIANANLVKKVYFPREILPLATIGVALFDFVLQSLVFFAFMIVFGYGFQLDVALAVSDRVRGAPGRDGRGDVLGLRAQRPLPRRAAPDRPRAPRLVLDDADRLRRRASSPGTSRRTRTARSCGGSSC